MKRASTPRASWRGFGVVDERLVFGSPNRLLGSCGATFERMGMKLTDACGEHHLFLWSAYDRTSLAPRGTWTVYGAQPHRIVGEITLSVAAGDGSQMTSFGLANWRAAAKLASSELTALVAHLAGSPSAQAGLERPTQLMALIGELSTGSWRHPRLPSPVSINGYVIPIDRHLPMIEHHLVRGTELRSADGVVERIIDGAPSWSRLAGERPRLERYVARVLAAGRWPFDVLGDSALVEGR